MRKTTLDLDSLEVATFATAPASAVIAEGAESYTWFSTCGWWCVPSTRSCG